MKKVKLYFPMLGRYFEFYTFDVSLKNNTKGTLFLKYLYLLCYSFVFFTILTTLFSDMIFRNTDSDTAVMKFLIITVLFNVGFYVGTAILNGAKRVIDPPFFIVVLIFALGTTTASVLTSSPDIGNTFGVPGIRGEAGITILLFAALFYLIGVFIHNRELVRRAFKFLLAGLYIYFIGKFLTQESIVNLVDMTLAVVLVGGIFSLLKSSPKMRNLKLCLLILFVILFGFAFYNSRSLFATFNVVFVPAIISLIIVLLTLIFAKKGFLKKIIKDTKKFFAQLRTKDFKLGSFTRLFTDWALLLSPIILTVIVIITTMNNNTVLNAIKLSLQNNLTIFGSLTNFSNGSSINTFLFGNGAAGLRISNSFIADIADSQGLIGLASYLFLWTFALIVSIRFVRKSFKNGGSYVVAAFLLFVMALITFESFIFYPGMKLLFVWWFCFGIISVKYRLYNKKGLARLAKEDLVVTEGKIFGKKINRFWKYLLTILVIIAIGFVAYSFNRVLI